MQENRQTTPEGKTITTTEHPDGRKDVHIEVNMLDVEATDEETQAAKDMIEGQILPNLKASMVQVVVIHKPSNESASKFVALPHVRAYAEAAIKAHGVGDPADYIIVEVHEGSFLTRVSTLENL